MTATSRDPDVYGDDARVNEILGRTDWETWAIVGLGDNPNRPAYGVARFLQSRGKRIVPVHPTAATVHGEEGFSTLADAVMAIGPIPVVDCFVRSALVGDVIDEAIAVGAEAVWLQLDVIDEDAAARARSAGLLTVMDRCPAIEWPRLQRTRTRS